MQHKAINAVQAKYPLYALRKYSSITEDDQYYYIHTHYNSYVLDIKNVEGNYAERRIALLNRDLPYKLYPLKERYSSISQLSRSKKRSFIDTNGDIVHYKPSQFFRIEYAKVLRADRTWNGYFRLTTKLPVSFVTEQVGNYIAYIRVGTAFYLYDICNERKPTSRKKL